MTYWGTKQCDEIVTENVLIYSKLLRDIGERMGDRRNDPPQITIISGCVMGSYINWRGGIEPHDPYCLTTS